jgi:ABC-type sugar transport system permease subunit
MSDIVEKVKQRQPTRGSFFSQIINVILVLLFDAGAIWFLYQTIVLGFTQLTVVAGIVVVLMNVIFLWPKAYPYRWLAIGLAFMIMFVIYPIFLTLYVAFTNYGDGHLLTKAQALPLIEKITYLPEGAASYSWTAYKSPEGNYALWLVDSEGNTFLGKPGESINPAKPGDPGIGEADSKGIPKTIEGYTRLNTLLAAADTNLPNIVFGVEGAVGSVQITGPRTAAALEQRFIYDAQANTFTDQSNGDLYNDVDGTYTTKDGKTIRPGYRAVIGFANFTRFLTSPAVRGPLVTIFIWNFIFPLISVLSTFSLGLAIAIMYNDKDFPLKKVIRTLLLIPYTLPSVITILTWRGMFSPQFGVINNILNSLFDWAPPWTTVGGWARAAILIVNLWLGFPYMMLITSGALQSIPTDLYEAATVDGASPWKRFTNITLPLLLVAVGPLLIASFIFNFNNFGLIYLFIGGGPTIPGAATQAGYTDILLSYVYNLAFASGGRGVQYGFASAISLILFIFVGAVTLLQYRFTNMWEEVSENV